MPIAIHLRKVPGTLSLACAMVLFACTGDTQNGTRALDGGAGSGGATSQPGGNAGGSAMGGTGGALVGGASAGATAIGGAAGANAGIGGSGGRIDAGSGGRIDAGVGGSSTGGSGAGGRIDGGAAGSDAGGRIDAGLGAAGAGGRVDAGAGGSPAGGAPGDGGAVDAATSRDAGTDGGRGQDAVSVDAGAPAACQEPPTIFAWTTSWGASHASKAILACGVYVVGSSAVADAALLRAQKILQVQLRKLSQDLPDVPAKLTASHSRVVVLGAKEDQSIYWPKASGRRSFCSWPDNNKMIEATTLEEELTSTQRSLLMTTVHEMGHFTQFIFYLYNRALYDRSVTAFNTCTKSLYNDYDLQDPQEFFAGDALRWFDLNPSDLAVSDAKTLSQREQLKKYSPTMYQIMSESYVTTAIP